MARQAAGIKKVISAPGAGPVERLNALYRLENNAAKPEHEDLVRVLLRRGAASPGKTAFRFLEEDGKESASLDYQQLHQRARAVAAALAAQGKPGDRVLLLYPPSLDFIAGFFGCLYAGMVAVPAYPPKNNRHMGRLKAILEDSQAGVALCVQSQAEKISKLAGEQGLKGLRILASDSLDPQAASRFEVKLPEADDLAFLQYTSGSTGTPKGVMVSHANLAHNSALIQRTWGHGPDSVMVSWLPLFHDLGLIGGVLQPVFAGFPAVLMAPATFLSRPLAWLEALSRYRGTSSCAPNFAYDYCVRKIAQADKVGLDLSHWRLALNAAEPIRSSTLDAFCRAFEAQGFNRETFFMGYGLAEATLQVSVGRLGRGPRVFMADPAALEKSLALPAASDNEARPIVGCGRVLDDPAVAVVDPASCAPLGEGRVGEVWVSSPSVAQGYWQRPEATQETFRARLRSGGRAGGWLRTGDLGFVREGELYLTGRLKDLLILRGHNHYPQDLELSAERSHPALRINGGAAFSVEEGGEERVVLVHEVERNREAEHAQVLEAVRKALQAEHEVSALAVVLIKASSLPKTSSGKVQRRATRRAYLEGSLEVVADWREPDAAQAAPGIQAPARALAPGEFSPVLARLRELAASKAKLPLDGVQAGDSLQGLGLDSIGIVEFKHLLDQAFGTDFSLDTLMEGLSLGQLSLRLEADLEPLAGAANDIGQPSFPLSPAQEALWFHGRLASGGSLYNIPAAWEIRGELDSAALHQALERLIRRHESLRTGFRERQGKPEAFAVPAGAWDWKEEQAGAEELPALLAEASAEAFDLERPPLMRARLFHLEPGRQVLLLVVHHLVADGWSFKILWEEIARLMAPGKSLPPEARLRFADWAAGPAAKGREESLAYWKASFASLPSRLELPWDRALPARQDYRGAAFHFDLGAGLSTRLRDFSKARGCGTFAVLHAAFQALLHRLSGQTDLCLGLPAANRGAKDSGAVVGYFVNLVALRTQVDPQASFEKFLAGCAARLKDAMPHQDLPFERLVRELRLNPDASSHPLFQALLAYQGPNPAPVSLGGLSISPLDLPCTGAKLDLALVLEERPSGLHASFEYRTDLFERATIARWAGHFGVLLEAALTHPETSLARLPLMSRGELRQVLAFSRGPRQPLSPRDSVQRRFERQAAEQPEAPALRWEGGQMSYGELNRRANQVAHALRAWGMGPGTIAAVCCRRSPEMVAALLGVLKAGGAFLPMDPSHPAERLSAILADSGAALLLTQGTLARGRELKAGRTVFLDEESGRLSHFSADNPVGMAGPAQLAYLIYTSGSTGAPKGVMVSHSSILNHTLAMQAAFNMNRGDRMLQAVSPGFDAALEEIFPTFASGGCLVLGPALGSMAAHEFASYCEGAGIHYLHLPAAYWAELLSALPESGILFPHLKALLVGGDSPSARQAARWRALVPPDSRFLHAYGPTEATVTATLFEAVPAWLEANSGLPKLPIGLPLANVRCLVLDSQGALAPLGACGELYLGGAGVAQGYLGMPEATAERFAPVKAGKRRFYRTGDMVRRRHDGMLEFAGRKDGQAKLRGNRLELGEVEAALCAHPDVALAVAAIAEDPQQLLGYVVNRPGRRVQEAELLQFLARRLPEFMLPSRIVGLEKLPLGATGKVDRRLLPAPSVQAPVPASAGGGREGALVEIFSEVLGCPVDEGTSFFSAGGHSLLAMRLVSEINRRLGVEIGLSAIFEHPSPAALASQLGDAGAGPEKEQLPPCDQEERALAMPSFGQESFWFFNQLQPGSPVYNMAAAWRLLGPLDIESLRLSLNDLVARHPSLRTSFKSVEGRPRMQVSPSASIEPQTDDLKDLPGDLKQQRLVEGIMKLAAAPFDLSKAPLMSAGIFRLDAREQVLALVFHHICGDGASLQVLMTELEEIYEARLEAREAILKPLARTYQDFSAWQRAWIKGPQASVQASYWRQALSGLPDSLELPADRARPATPSFRGSSVALEFSPALGRALADFCAGRNCTPHMALLTAFLAWLGRASRQDSVACGIPVANRRHLETAGMAGLFMNTLTVRLDLHDQTFAGALAQVRRRCLEAYGNQDLPFEKVVEALNVRRVPGAQPLIQAMMAFQNLDGMVREMGGAKLEPLELPSCASRLDLTLHLHERAGAYTGCLEYSSDLFLASTARRFAGQFVTLLEAGLAIPDAKVSALPMMSRLEREKIVFGWNDTRAPYPDGKGVHQLFEAIAAEFPGAPAVRAGEQGLSYAELNRRANQLAWHLRSLGVGQGSLVGLLLERGLDLVVGMLAVLKSGGAYVPLDAEYPQERLRLMLEDAAPAAVLTQKALAARLPEGPRALLVDDPGAFSHWPAQDLEPTSGPADLAYVIFTSGSTGRPKGVMIEHRGVCRLVRNGRFLQIGPGDVVTQTASQSFDLSVNEFWGALANGAELVMVPKGLLLDAAGMEGLIRERGVTTMILATPIFNHLCSRNPRLFSGLKSLVLGGEALDPKWVRECLRQGTPRRLINAYGPTECTVWSVCDEVREVPQGASSVPIGRPIANDQVYVLDALAQPCPVGVPGELYIGGLGVARGYLNRPELNAEKFVPNPFGAPGDRLYRTGDLVRWLEDGRLDFIARMDNQVKISGHRIELGEIEAVLGALPGVGSAVVLARAMGEGDKRLVAYVCPAQGAAPSPEALRSQAALRLPRHMLPSHFLILAALPLNANGKVDRKALAEIQLEEGRPAGGSVQPRTHEERQLAAIWREVLKAPGLGMEDDFFAAGGHSLLAVQLVARINSDLNRALALGDLLANPNMAALARVMEARGQGGGVDSLVPLSGGGTLPPLFLVHPIGGSVLCYAGLGRLAGEQRPVYAFEAPGLVRGSEAAADVGGLASRYLERLLMAQPQGPYHLAGWSFGGVVAYEMARQLEALGRACAFLGLIDSGLPTPSQRRLAGDEQALLSKFRQDLRALPGPAADGEEARLFEVYRAHMSALLGYQPGQVRARISLFLAEERPGDDRQDLAMFWESLSKGGLQLRVVPGDHYSLMSAHNLPELALRLEEALEASAGQAEPVLLRSVS